VDEKPSIQAFGASAGLSEVAQWPRLDRPDHDYKRHGTTTLFVSARSRHRKDHRYYSKRRRRVEFLRFHETASPPLFQIASFTSFLDNLKHPQEKRTLAQGHPNVRFHFTPTSRVLAQSGRGMVSRSCKGSR